MLVKDHGIYWMNEDSQIHRLDGPAVIWNNGRKEWWINGNPVTVLIEPWAKDMEIDLDNLSEEDKLIIEIKWADYSENIHYEHR